VALGDEKYMRLTTFRRDGRPVATPVWVVKLDGDRIGFWTSSGSGKAKRLAHTARVTVAPGAPPA
jgi:PPOX class probable F420-dependent enzyme